jgi:integrase/recombinase XerD
MGDGMMTPHMSSEAVLEFALSLSRQEMKADRLTKKSRARIEKAQNEFASWVQTKGYALETMGKAQLAEYHQELCQRKAQKTGEPLVAATVNALFQNAVKLFSILYTEEVIKENPAHNLELVLPENRGLRRRPLTFEEITTFLENIDTSTAQGLKDRTLFELIYSSGLRVSEACGIKVKDIDFERREVIVKGKRDRDRVVPISKVARDFLIAFLGLRVDEPDTWLFCGTRIGKNLSGESVSRRFRTLLRRFNMDKKEISTHSIRHSTATHLLENGASVRHIQELLGHRYIETTVRYTQIQTDGVFKVFRKFHPREHELFESVDVEYKSRFEALLDGEGKWR